MSSTIEQLRIAHRLALRAQHAVAFDTAALVRTWPRLAVAAHEAHRCIPEMGHFDDQVVERIALDAKSLGETIERQPWPGRGEPDGDLLQVAVAFERVAAGGGATMSAADIAEAQRLVTSSLWTTSQLVGRSTRELAFDLRLDRKNFNPSLAQSARLATDNHRRFNAVEQLAANSLRNRPSPVTRDVVGQLRHAIATWDVESHRALLSNRSTAVLHVLAHQEAASVKAFELFVDQASDNGILDLTTAGRLRPVLNDSSASWAELRDVAADLSFGHTAVPLTIIDAANDLRERFQDAIRTADPEDYRLVLSALSGHLASAVTISAAGRDLITDGELRAPARALARMSAVQRPDIIVSPVDPVAIHRGLSIPLTDHARLLLDAPAARVFLDADEVLNRASGVDTLYRNPSAGGSAASTTASRHSEHTPPPVMRRTVAGPGIGP